MNSQKLNHRRLLIAGNWKLHKTIGESIGLVDQLKSSLSSTPNCEIVVAPPFTALASVHRLLKNSFIKLAAQNVYWENQGAFTGEISAPLLADCGCSYVIVGHSERRQLFGETDEDVSRKVRAVLAANMGVILCVGETIEERKLGKTTEIALNQVKLALRNLPLSQLPNVVIAYEPIWAIGTGMTASPEDAEEVQLAIRQEVAKLFEQKLADAIRILYGGSVKPENAASLMAKPNVDGALVGGASLKPDSFLPIVKAAG